jgi:hypothetical protein
MLDNSCPECNRLWREYTSAAAEHLKLKGQMGALYGSGLYEIAKRATEIAEQHQEAVRIKIAQHETLRHRSLREA